MSKLRFNYLVWRKYKVFRVAPFIDADFKTNYTDVYLKKNGRIAKTCISGTWSMSDLAPTPLAREEL